MHCSELNLNNFKYDFLNILIFSASSDSIFSNIVQTIHQWKYYLFSFLMMHKSQFLNIAPYDWFCAPESQMTCLAHFIEFPCVRCLCNKIKFALSLISAKLSQIKKDSCQYCPKPHFSRAFPNFWKAVYMCKYNFKPNI